MKKILLPLIILSSAGAFSEAAFACSNFAGTLQCENGAIFDLKHHTYNGSRLKPHACDTSAGVVEIGEDRQGNLYQAGETPEPNSYLVSMIPPTSHYPTMRFKCKVTSPGAAPAAVVPAEEEPSEGMQGGPAI